MTLVTTDLAGILPGQTLDAIIDGTKNTSTIAALSTAEPMKFGQVSLVDFDAEAVAEFVDERGAKSSQDVKPTVVSAVPHKAVVTFRTSDEFMWADEDYQLGIFDKFAVKASDALAKALDLGAYFRINPKTGNEIESWTNYLNSTTNRVQLAADSDPELVLEAAAGLLVPNGIAATGAAFSSGFGWDLKTARYADGRRKFPEFNANTAVSESFGMRVSTSTTVQGKARDEDATDNGVRAIVGDYNRGIRWGIQRDIPFQIIPYGDPDNSGRDLKGHNEIALRAEVVYAWYVYANRFAVVETATAGA